MDVAHFSATLLIRAFELPAASPLQGMQNCLYIVSRSLCVSLTGGSARMAWESLISEPSGRMTAEFRTFVLAHLCTKSTSLWLRCLHHVAIPTSYLRFRSGGRESHPYPRGYASLTSRTLRDSTDVLCSQPPDRNQLLGVGMGKWCKHLRQRLVDLVTHWARTKVVEV